MTINPADWWGPEPKPINKPQGARQVRLCHDDEEEEAMPKGVYDRSKAKPRGAEAAPAVNDAPQPRQKRRYTKRATAVVPSKPAKANGAAPRFDVSLDLRGGAVTINAARGSLTLAPDEVLALFAFIGRR